MGVPLKERCLSIDTNENRIVRSTTLRTVLWVIGTIALILGVLGIFLPILPTTPFLLLTAYCYLRSSTRFYQWLISHPLLSRYVLAYLDGSGIPRKAKYYTISMLWLTMSFSIYIVPLWPIRIAMAALAIAVSIYIWRLPDLEVQESSG